MAVNNLFYFFVFNVLLIFSNEIHLSKIISFAILLFIII